MRRYIDADLLKDKTTRVNNIWNGTTNAEGKGLDEIIDDIPTADVVEVVRCKDCRHCITEYGIGEWYGSCRYWNTHSVMADDYCSRFERAES